VLVFNTISSYLEAVSDEEDDPLDLLGKGKFGRAKDLREEIRQDRENYECGIMNNE